MKEYKNFHFIGNLDPRVADGYVSAQAREIGSY